MTTITQAIVKSGYSRHEIHMLIDIGRVSHVDKMLVSVDDLQYHSRQTMLRGLNKDAFQIAYVKARMIKQGVTPADFHKMVTT